APPFTGAYEERLSPCGVASEPASPDRVAIPPSTPTYGFVCAKTVITDVRKKKKTSTCRTTLRCIAAHLCCTKSRYFFCQNLVNPRGIYAATPTLTTAG